MKKKQFAQKIILTSVVTILSLSALTAGTIAVARISKEASNHNGVEVKYIPVSTNSSAEDYLLDEDMCSTEGISENEAELVTQSGAPASPTDADSGNTLLDDIEDINKIYAKNVTKYIPIITPTGGGGGVVADVPVDIQLSPSDVQSSPAGYSYADGSYFDDAVFIGNSRTEGLLLYTGVSGTGLAYRGLNVCTAYTTPCININGSYMSVMSAVQYTSFSKAYIMFGINEVGWYAPESYINYYRQIIQDVRAVNPNARIYIQSVLPVTASYASCHNITNQKIYVYNSLLRSLADEQGVIFLNVAENFADEYGNLPESASPDGFHFYASYYQLWLDYLKSHVVY